MADDERHPVLVDSDALIAVANTQLWNTIIETFTMNTSNDCMQNDHDSASDHGHDVTDEGLHIDVYRDGEKYRTG